MDLRGIRTEQAATSRSNLHINVVIGTGYASRNWVLLGDDRRRETMRLVLPPSYHFEPHELLRLASVE